MIKIFECKLCKHKGGRKEIRKHIRKEHFWKAEKSLSILVKSHEFK